MKIPLESFENIQQFLQSFKGDINILERIVNVEKQVAYFEKSQQFKSLPPPDNWEELAAKLYTNNIIIEEKEKLLIQLASIDDPKVYRFLESYSAQCSEDIKDWAILALQESRLLLQSKLLEQPQLLISTGLGGKGNKLRYFFVLFNRNKQPYTAIQEKIIREEVSYFLSKYDAEVEDIHFHNHYASVVALIPIFAYIPEVLRGALREINQYGNFVHENCIITNVRTLNDEEIEQLLNQKFSDNFNEDIFYKTDDES